MCTAGCTRPQLVADVALHARRGRGGVGVKRRAGKRLAQPGQLPVLRPEVVAPLADAMRFVDGDVGDAACAHQRAEAVGGFADSALRRDIEQPAGAGAQQVERRATLLGRLPAVQARGRHALRDQAVDLILHQRDERGDDEGD